MTSQHAVHCEPCLIFKHSQPENHQPFVLLIFKYKNLLIFIKSKRLYRLCDMTFV